MNIIEIRNVYIARNVHSRSAGRPTIHLLKEQGKQLFTSTACWVTGTENAVVIPLTSTRGRKGFAPCLWWETLCCHGGSEGWLLFFYTTLHNSQWAGTAEHTAHTTHSYLWYMCANVGKNQASTHFKISCPLYASTYRLHSPAPDMASAQIAQTCLLGSYWLTLSLGVLIINDGFFLYFPTRSRNS